VADAYKYHHRGEKGHESRRVLEACPGRGSGTWALVLFMAMQRLYLHGTGQEAGVSTLAPRAEQLRPYFDSSVVSFFPSVYRKTAMLCGISLSTLSLSFLFTPPTSPPPHT
jgi:hypothetical protein